MLASASAAAGGASGALAGQRDHTGSLRGIRREVSGKVFAMSWIYLVFSALAVSNIKTVGQQPDSDTLPNRHTAHAATSLTLDRVNFVRNYAR
jgi:hypothetical protein